MLLKKIKLYNYRQYKGEHLIDLLPRVRYNSVRPIILFGGLNGAGKTTFLEAVQLALYGRRSLEGNASKSEYHRALKERIHEPQGSACVKAASVEIDFQYVIRGEQNDYNIKRVWEINDNKITESCVVMKNGVKDKSIDLEQWDAFIESIVPQRLSRLFFFDGERIKDIANDETSSEAMANSIKALLGLDLIERLRADIGVYIAKEAKKVANEEQGNKLSIINHDLRKLDQELIEISQEEASLESTIHGIKTEITHIEQKLHSEGWGYAKKREELKENKASCLAKIEVIEKNIRLLTEKEFPFVLCSNLCSRLEDSLESESIGQVWSAIKDNTEEIVDELIPKISSKKKLKLLIDDIVTTLNKSLHDISTAKLKKHSRVHALSQEMTYTIKKDFQSAQSEILPELNLQLNELEDLNSTLSNIESNLMKSPDEQAIKPMVDQLQKLNKDLGRRLQEQRNLSDRARGVNNDYEACLREEQRITDRIKSNDKIDDSLHTAKTSMKALEQYLEKLTKEKIELLRHAIIDNFNTLIRKGNFLSDISIDPKTFSVTIYKNGRRPFAKKDLSEGEKQIFAVSFLWSLAQTSGRSLPTIIDTPLGRLDSVHREALVEKYYPKASHQVILLSTDTEITPNLYGKLKSDISHSYQIVYNKELGKSHIQEGYFGEQK